MAPLLPLRSGPGLLLGAVLACAHAPARPAPVGVGSSARVSAPTVTAAACIDSARASLGSDTLEARLLRGTGGRVLRTGCDLIFRGDGGGTELVLSDVLQEGAAWLLHRYRGYLAPLNAHLVERGRYEGGSYLLVFPGGALVDVAGPPLLSPDSARFAAWNLDLVAEYDPNVLQVWRRTPGAARLELAIESQEWGPSEVRWIDQATVAFLQTFPTDDPNANVQRPVQLRLRHGRWMVELQTR